MVQALLHERGADMFFLRHVFLFVRGLCSLTEHLDVRLFGRSAGTHSALAFAAHLDELNAEWDGLLGPQPRTPWQTDRHEAQPSSSDGN